MDYDNIGEEWMKEAPMLAAMEVKNPFLVPKGYFDSLPEHINASLSLENSSFWKKEKLGVPEGYFEQLSAQIETRIAVEKIKELVPVHGFTVPIGYFDNLSERITIQINHQTKYPEPAIKKMMPGWKKYAAAACVTLAIGIAAFLNLKVNNFDSRVSKIPDQEIINYLQVNTDAADINVILQNLDENGTFSKVDNNVSTEELEQYINTSL